MTLQALAFGPSPQSLPADTPVVDALRHMLEQRFNHVALADEAGRFVGLLSVQAILHQIIPSSARVDHGLSDLAFAGDALPMLLDHFRQIGQVPAASLLSGPGTLLPSDTPLLEAALMLCRHSMPLPVVDAQGRLVGILSARTLLAYLNSRAGTA